MPKPIKRHQALQPISREHHHGLLLSWKINEGFRRKIDPSRIEKYTNWFWENHLQAHFEFEEQFIFPILGVENQSVSQALRDHSRLRQLFSSSDKTGQRLALIAEALVAHIRFEERILFKEVEQVASEKQLKGIENTHSINVLEEWHDEFWVKEKEIK